MNPPDPGSAVPTDAASDAELIDRCLQGQPTAWERLYATTQPTLLASVRHALGLRRNDENLVHELSARVWLRLLSPGACILRRFDPKQRARLTTFVAGIARNEVRNFLRSEGRQRRRDAVACRDERQQYELLSRAEVEEFLETLTQRERSFLEWATDPRAAGQSWFSSANNDYQLRFRLRRKLRQYFQSAGTR